MEQLFFKKSNLNLVKKYDITLSPPQYLTLPSFFSHLFAHNLNSSYILS